MEKFTPKQPDPLIRKERDMGLAKFGHLNAIVDETNGITDRIDSIDDNVYANNAAAVAGGLVAGQLYRTTTGEVRIVV